METLFRVRWFFITRIMELALRVMLVTALFSHPRRSSSTPPARRTD
jgi:hypothetical protein